MAIHIQNPPEAKPERISRLVTRLEQGDIKVPVFQHKFVWSPRQILELLDSIYKGYPIGSLLFWLSEKSLAAERNLGDFPLPTTPNKYPRNYVLDGQQRLATIYGVLRWQGRPEDESIFNISFDLEEKHFLPTQSPRPDTHVPMSLLFDTPRFRQFQVKLLTRPDGQDLVEASDVLLETFREYSIPVITVTEATVDDVSSIFERINNTGTKLTVYDLMIAATWSEHFDLRQYVDSILEELEEKDFADISPVAILQTLASQVGSGASKSAILSLQEKEREVLVAGIAAVRESLKRGVDFLVNEVCVKSSSFLPYDRQLIALAYGFTNRGQLSSQDCAVLRRWFWRTSFSERYRRGGEGLFDEDLTTVRAALDDDRLLERFGRPLSGAEIKNAEFRKVSALSSAFVALLASRSPRNLLNGTLIDTGTALSTYNRKEFHHIFPQAFLGSMGVPRSAVNSLANICMLSAEQNKQIRDQRPSVYFRTLQDTLGEEFLPVLRSNLIPESALTALMSDDFEGFLTHRAAYIAETVQSYCG